MLISDWGGFTKIENDKIYYNFTYFGVDYLDPFSEVWAGDTAGHVASAYEGSEEGIFMGEWQATTPSGGAEYVSEHPDAVQIIHAQYAPNRYNGFPFKITIDQYTHAWDSTAYPADDDYIMMKLVLTNNGASELNEFYLAVQTGWMVNPIDEKGDLMDWDAQRRAGIAYDSSGTDPTHVALVLISGKFASHNIVDISTWGCLDSDRSKLMSNGEIDDLKTIGGLSSGYLNVISAGPYTIAPGGSVSVVYAFVAGQNLEALKKNIDAAISRAMVPAGLTATPSKEAIHLKWLPSISPDIVAYKIYRKMEPGGSYSEIARVSAENTSYSDAQTVLGTTYYYAVTGISADGIESGYSNEVHATPGVAPPPPGTLTVKSDQFSRPVLVWEVPSDGEVAGYRIFRNSTGTKPWTAIATVDSSVRSFVDQNTYDGNTYYYTVASVNKYGWISEYSNVVSYAVNLPKPPKPAKDLNEVCTAPNPCKLSSKLKFMNLTPRATIYVYTITGELVKTIYHTNGSGEEEWDLRNGAGAMLASGIYVYCVEAYKPEEAGKLIASGKFAIVE